MRGRSCLALLLLASAAFTESAHHAKRFMQDEGDVFSRSELVREIPPGESHQMPRKVLAAQEGEISCEAVPHKILAVHYRAEPAARFSKNDDRIVVALEQNSKFRILKVLESDTALVDGALSSDVDFEQEFIAISGMHFLYIRSRFSGSGNGALDDVYTISSDDRLSTIPFEDVSKSKLLTAGEELRKGGYQFEKGEFSFESGVYKTSDSECCPSNGVFHAMFKLSGEFKKDADKNVVTPDFKFVVEKEWRSNDR